MFSFRFVWPVLLLSILFIPTNSEVQEPRTESTLTVHEWGTFTAVVARNGDFLTWRPIFRESDLPSFVHSVDMSTRSREFEYPSKSSTFVTVRMETPVIYFYSPHELMVNVRTSFPSGRMTEWYPQAKRMSRGTLMWDAKIDNAEFTALQRDDQPNHYYAARETDAAPVSVIQDGTVESEKFLFYRGVGSFSLPITVGHTDNHLRITNNEGEGVPRAIIFENRGGKIGWAFADLSSQSNFARPVLNSELSSLREQMTAMLVAAGLYQREADAMLETWSTSWFEDGLRIFYLMPRATVDKVLPLTFNPKPASLERVFVGRMELMTPETEAEVKVQLSRLDDPSAVVQAEAKKVLGKYGRFLESILLEVKRQSTDEELKTKIDRFFASRVRQ